MVETKTVFGFIPVDHKTGGVQAYIPEGGYPFNGSIYENYDEHWGFMNFSGKRVLDMGADVGSTPSYFLSRGARDVIGVSGKGEYIALVENCKKYGMVNCIPKDMWVSSIQDCIDLITEFKPDIIKCDLDPEIGGEKMEWHLLNVPDDLFKTVPEYAIEWHNGTDELLRYAWPKKFLRLGYTVIPKYHEIVFWAKK